MIVAGFIIGLMFVPLLVVFSTKETEEVEFIFDEYCDRLLEIRQKVKGE